MAAKIEYAVITDYDRYFSNSAERTARYAHALRRSGVFCTVAAVRKENGQVTAAEVPFGRNVKCTARALASAARMLGRRV